MTCVIIESYTREFPIVNEAIIKESEMREMDEWVSKCIKFEWVLLLLPLEFTVATITGPCTHTHGLGI